MLVQLRFPTGLTTTVRCFRNSCASCGAVVRNRDFYQGVHTPLKSGYWYYVDMVWRNKQGVQEGSICKCCGGDALQKTKGYTNPDDALTFLPRFHVPGEPGVGMRIYRYKSSKSWRVSCQGPHFAE